MESEFGSSVIQQAVKGDRDAQSALMARYRPLVRLIAARHARRVMGTRFDESDITQATCVEALNGLDTFRGQTQAEFTCWLESILEKTLVRLWRFNTAQKRDLRSEIQSSESKVELAFQWSGECNANDPVSQLVSGETAMIVAEALEKLPDELRRPIELRFIDGLKLREISEVLETTTGAIAGRLRRGLAMLREHLPAEAQGLMEY